MKRSFLNAYRTRLLMLLFVLAASLSAFGQSQPQSTPQPLNPGTVVTGQCQGNESEPGCVLPNLFGAQGLSLFPISAFPHYAHFIGSAETTLNQTLSSAIATQLAILPFISPSSGFTYRYDSSSGAFVRTTTSFGPIYTERAETIGRRKVSIGASYQRFRFDRLDGIDLHQIPAVFSHVPDTGPNGAPETYESDVIATTNNLKVNMDQTMLFATVGVLDHLDVSVAVPLSSMRMSATSNANIIRVSGPTFTLSTTGQVFPNPHEFDASGTQSKVFSSSGSASGLGDITLRTKGTVFQSESLRVALALDVRTPTGDARKFLGSGAVGLRPFLVVSTGKRFTPHANIGYQWNGESILAGNITGTNISENSSGIVVIQNGPALKQKLPGQFFYWLGMDFGIANRRLTLDLDYLGQTVFNAPRISQRPFVTDSIPGGTGALSLPNIVGVKNNVALNSGSVGAKYAVYRRLLLTGDVLFRLDNKGLRQNVTPLASLQYSFGK
jgi:Putative MetA-pathway of phenol degradation